MEINNKWNSKNLRLISRRLGLDFNTIIDVGVARGTPELYKAFNSKKIILIEPLDIYKKNILNILNSYDAKWLKTAAGNIDDTISFFLDKKLPSMSSIHSKTKITSGSDDIKSVKIPIKKIDTIVNNNNLEGPYLIKIDTEGHELEVIKGASKTLQNTNMVIAEISVAKRFNNSYTFSEFIAEMRNHDFELLDILTFTSTPPKFIDAIFTKKPWVKKI